MSSEDFVKAAFRSFWHEPKSGRQKKVEVYIKNGRRGSARTISHNECATLVQSGNSLAEEFQSYLISHLWHVGRQPLICGLSFQEPIQVYRYINN